VETAFLEGGLDEDIYMDCPEGMDGATGKECLHLLKSIYGLVQAARQWWKRLVMALKKIGFKGGDADPCLYTKRSQNGIVFIGLYVDDCLCIGNTKMIDETIRLLTKEGLTLKVEDTLKDYLSCEILFAKDGKKAWIGQPHLMKNLIQKFGKIASTMQVYNTPGTPGKGILKVKDDKAKITQQEQSLYRSGVGMLLYLVKHSRPDIANTVRELAKVMEGANYAALKELHRCIKFVLDTKEWGLRMEPTFDREVWDLKVYCDSDYAGDPDSRISVSGFVVYVRGVPVSWKSKGQKSVTLSSTEAEFVALAEATKEVKFVAQVMESMSIEVNYPIIVRVDNVGAIFLTENATTSQRTKHIDVKYHYVRQYVEDGIVKIIFVRTDENDADGFTKNVSGTIYERHRRKYMAKRGDVIGDRPGNKEGVERCDRGSVPLGRRDETAA
jgi:hypothetical protein